MCCDKHSISSFANKVSLSSSRLSHLFKEQAGLPLKSYQRILKTCLDAGNNWYKNSEQYLPVYAQYRMGDG